MLDKLTLVLGGAGSGKSLWAETLVTGTGAARLYLATAQAWDQEMQAKVTRHKAQRGANWTTIEAPLDVTGALAQARADQVVLLDCATMWLSNHLLADSDLPGEQARLLTALLNCAAPVVVVSNELGMSVVPDNALARQFREAQGRLNQALAAQAGLVVAVMAGLPLALKGQLP
ncbi:bifunctional adenosylcobinamide kinase/adenosylcobinamide-phosphate guanylyltransferase [Thalassovita taeanensis]|uniref:Bifunctional adenosylcobalamin biosynthesis protein n=1 Tax=Thalassovita taeanensis TaxID=657014 RepID=A0A1H9DDV2_9RHOB|nr:bifunctional adenosylcobinamide kinase/adenosylcobinamide-phosphate guanylyltransferase [Thalassovita taeanensis]SEQ11487.1 adenosylcobinamide kinase /adenosylcobinamide-phosphate guanylyltransferase [Thalassovita taeanensis]